MADTIQAPQKILKERSMEGRGLFLLSNIRTQRDPKQWTIETPEGLIADVKATKPVDISGGGAIKSWYLDISINMPACPWKLISVRAENEDGVIVRPVKPDQRRHAGPKRLSVEVAAPQSAHVDIEHPENPGYPSRIPVRLVVELETDEGRRIIRLDPDSLFTCGDSSRDADGLRSLAEKHMNDPAIKKLLRVSANIPRGSLSEEVERLRVLLELRRQKTYPKATGHSEEVSRGYAKEFHDFLWTGRYHNDPNMLSLPDRAPYILSPSEVMRFGGGDCEDWAILTAAYLAQRGFEVWLVQSATHAWVVAMEGGKAVGINYFSLTEPNLGSRDFQESRHINEDKKR